jgi:hypothetical protein
MFPLAEGLEVDSSESPERIAPASSSTCHAMTCAHSLVAPFLSS